MRQVLSVIAAAALVGVAFGAVIGPNETIADNEATTGFTGNTVSIHGLYVALPAHMTDFPRELVPLP